MDARRGPARARRRRAPGTGAREQSPAVNLPNLITLGRLLSVPVVVYLLMQTAYMAAFLLFVAAGISDALDGYLAKRYNQTTRIGAFLDPLADKTLLVSIYVTLGLQGELPNWLVVLVVFRDLLIVGGAVLSPLVRVEVMTRPLRVSKLNTAVQIGLAAFVLGQLALEFRVELLESALVYLAAATTAASGASYLVYWARQTAGNGRNGPPAAP